MLTKETLETENSPIEISIKEFYLRVIVAKDAMCQFCFSNKRQQFSKVSARTFKAREGKWIGAKVGLFFTRPSKFNDAGTADVDWFRFEK